MQDLRPLLAELTSHSGSLLRDLIIPHDALSFLWSLEMTAAERHVVIVAC